MRGSKYRSIKATVDGIVFDSKSESRRYIALKAMQNNGEISDLRTQESFLLLGKQKGERSVSYLADFTYMQDGVKVVEDVKSKATITPVYVIKRKLMLFIHNIRIKQVYM